jgi:Na+/melibiose symporter-like transporter
MSTAHISRARLALYGLPNLPFSFVGLPLALYLPRFYSQELALDLAAVGLVIAACRITDVVTDPLIGTLSDRWQTRFGRRKPWIIAGIPLLMISMWQLFVPSGTPSLWYLFGWVALLYLAFTLISLPYNAWGAELSKDYAERSRVTGWREAIGVVGTIVSISIPIGMVSLGYLDVAGQLFGVAVAVVVLTPLLAIPALLLVPEPEPDSIARDPISGWQKLGIAWRNGPFRRLVISFLFFITAITMTASLSIFFVTQVMGESTATYAMFIFVYYLATTLGVPIWLRISDRLGKHRTVVLAIVWLSIWSAPIPLLEPGDFYLFLFLMIMKGSSIGALVFLPASMAADVIDVDTLQTGEQRSGLFFSLWGMINKGGVALGVLVATNLAAMFGFEPTAGIDNTPGAKLAIACLYSVIPAGLALVALPLLWRYPITREYQAQLRQQIADARRTNEPLQAADAE